MQRKQLIWLGVFVGSTIGGYIPSIWGAGVFSLSGIFLGGLGAIAGIYIMYKISE
jgi:hypothetical protein